MLTVKVNGDDLGLVHKGSMHFAKNTAPDVCKTPSPGGPIPIPYPVIISMSSNLANGTTTVKADRGKMIAVKGCDYSMCTGDEPGTAGGVVSNTFKKEAKFILYSFNVKMDGKNACRQGDKMTMNHQNTVCMGGTFPTNCRPSEYPLNIDCDEKKKDPPTSPAWTDCMIKQMCAKIKVFNKRKKKKQRISPSPSQRPSADPLRKAYDNGRDRFVEIFEAKVAKYGVKSRKVQSMFMHKCAYDEWAGPPNNGTLPLPRDRSNTGYNPDHLHDAALGGSLGTRNLKWFNSRVNQTIGPAMGSEMGGFDPDKHKTIKANPNCKCK